MAVNGIILLTIVSSYVACGQAAPTVANNELTLSQLKGEWFEVGKVSQCRNEQPYSCYTHILGLVNDKEFWTNVILYENISNCDQGIPHYIDDYNRYRVDSKIHTNDSTSSSSLTLFRGSSFVIRSYNNGKELIFVEFEDRSCSSALYKLWSREREVSAETKAEFEKLSRNTNVAYYSYNSCPKLRGEVDEHSVKVKFHGRWYGIARILPNDLYEVKCLVYNISVNYEENTFTVVANATMNERSFELNQRGKLIESGTVLSFEDSNGHDLYGIRCNSGEDIIWVKNYENNMVLISRNVSTETMTGFKELADKLFKTNPFIIHTTFPHDDCPKMNE